MLTRWHRSNEQGNRRTLVVGLSRRERECLILLASGEVIKRIAVQLEISERTVEKHLASVRRKLKARTTVQAVVKGALKIQEIAAEIERLSVPSLRIAVPVRT
jgi:DNA-binding CsgD family transcriptional regulator